MSSHHAPRGDRRSQPFERASALKREGWEFATTYATYPTTEDREHIERTFGVPTAADYIEAIR
jgi:hypothetical protein